MVKKKMSKNEIDDIFEERKGLKKKDIISAKDENREVKEEEVDSTWADSRGEKRRKTEDGLLIYNLDELGVGKGGDSKDCPFDCSCCY